MQRETRVRFLPHPLGGRPGNLDRLPVIAAIVVEEAQGDQRWSYLLLGAGQAIEVYGSDEELFRLLEPALILEQGSLDPIHLRVHHRIGDPIVANESPRTLQRVFRGGEVAGRTLRVPSVRHRSGEEIVETGDVWSAHEDRFCRFGQLVDSVRLGRHVALRLIKEHPREDHAPEAGARPTDAMETLVGTEAQESEEVPSRRSHLRLKIRGMLLEHQREDLERVVSGGRSLFLLERSHLFAAGGAELHEMPPSALIEDPKRQLAARNGAQELAGDMDVRHFP